ncbi:hypothetical protein KUV57_12955 [Epibacterium sp. DP7N7-1]|nr:hypothetical protein [Epibacterium sp. DP7N7-1]
MSAKSKNDKRPSIGLTLLATAVMVGNGVILYDVAYPGKLSLFDRVAVDGPAVVDLAPPQPPRVVDTNPITGAEVPSVEHANQEGDALPPSPLHDKATAVSRDDSGGEGLASYALGDGGMTEEVRQALEMLESARSSGGAAEPLTLDSDYFRRAAREIGYVPSGVDPKLVRSLGEATEEGPSSISGVPEFKTADTLLVDDIELRLQGAVAPREGDICMTASGSAYDCASWSLNGMVTIVGGREVVCHITDDLSGNDDALLGWCDITLNNGKRRDLGEIAVQSGILRFDDAASQPSPYLRAEKNAQASGNGIWSGRYESLTKKKDSQ